MNSHESKIIQAAKAAKKRDLTMTRTIDALTQKHVNKLLRKLAAQPEPHLRLVTVNGERV
ncbi:MAG TPA: hypothetical protein DCW37_07285 [Cellvibrionales bacterium]|nr:hypothetical protein [Cellvibrionales bacterium]